MSKQDKRKRLMDAAYKVFVRKGYHHASIKDIADEAEMTPGLIHYYFKNKEELLLSVQEEVQNRYHRQYEGQQDDRQDDQQDDNQDDTTTLESVLLEIKCRAGDNPDWYRWRYEIYSLGVKNESGQFEKEVASILKKGRDSLSAPLQKLLGDSPHTDGLAAILLACFDGLALQKIVDDEFDIDHAYELLNDLLVSYLDKHKKNFR